MHRLREAHPTDSRKELAERLVKSHARRAGLGGAVTGALALVALPVGLPAGVAVTMAVEASLLLSLLELYGFPASGTRGRTRLYALWAGGGLADAARSAGLKAGADLAGRAIAGSLPARVIARLNPVLLRAILRRLGLGWVPRALKLWPVLGAPLGYIVDAAAMRALGRAAVATLESAAAARPAPRAAPRRRPDRRPVRGA